MYYLQGLTMGIAYAAPIGMQNLFVIGSALEHTRRRALLTALIVVFFDISLMLACFFGAGAAIERFSWLRQGLLLVGGGVVVYIGVGLIRSQAADLTQARTAATLPAAVSSAFVVTWFNPQALLDGTMLFGAFRASLPDAQAPLFVCGVMTASCLWFPSLALLFSAFKSKLGPKFLRGMNIVCGSVVTLYGLKLLWTFLSGLLAA